MRNTLCTSKWHSRQHRLAPPSPSKVILSVVDNCRIPSQGRWTGIVNVAGTEALQSFEILIPKAPSRPSSGNHGYATSKPCISTLLTRSSFRHLEEQGQSAMTT